MKVEIITTEKDIFTVGNIVSLVDCKKGEELIVMVTEEEVFSSTFEGTVIKGNSDYAAGYVFEFWAKSKFTELPKNTVIKITIE